MYPVLLNLGPVAIGSFGFSLVVAFLAGSFVIWKRGRDEHFEEESLFDAILIILFWSLLGARVLYVMLNFDNFGFDLMKMASFTKFSGMSFLGGALTGLITLSIYARAKKWIFFEIADIFAVGLALAQAIGYVGLFLNGGGYGTLSNAPWAVSFPGVEGTRHPTQLYAMLLLLLLFLFLSKVISKYRTYDWYKASASAANNGLVFFVYLIGLGILNLMLAFLSPMKIYWFRFALVGWIGLGLIILGFVGGYVRSGRIWRDDLSGIKRAIMGLVKKTSGSKKISLSRNKRKKRKREITAGMDVK